MATPSLDQPLATLPDLLARHQAVVLTGPYPGSKAARDAVLSIGTFTWDLSLTSVAVAMDHLQAWDRMRRVVRPAFAHLTLLRSVMEGAVRARWLCDPSADQSERIARGTGAQIADYEQRMKFERDAGGKMTDPAKPASERIDEIRVVLRKRRLAARPPLGVTDLFERYGIPSGEDSGRTTYRILSAFAHAKQWPILPSSTHELLVAELAENSSGYRARVTSDDEIAVTATQMAVNVMSAAMNEIELYGGLRRDQA